MIAPVLALAALTLAPLALGQKIVWQRDGVKGQHRFTGVVRAIGDLDGDGWEDVAAFVNLRGGVWGEEIWFLSGRNGDLLRVRGEYRPSWAYENIARAGDMNGDGVPDYVFRARDPSVTAVVEVASGTDDTLIWRVERSSSGAFGRALLGDIDINADGRPDILATTPGDSSNVRIRAYDHAGRLLYVVHRPPPT